MHSPTVGRQRPKDRKDRIAQVAAELFCERGYHGVSLEDIAGVVGISAPAVYRHFENKYAILVAATRDLIDATLTATALPLREDAWDSLDDLLDALARLAVTHRKTAGLYQWVWRHLTREHQAEVRDDLDELVRRVSVSLFEARPDLGTADAEATTRATFSIFGSLGTHRAVIAKGRAQQLLFRAGRAVLQASPPTPVSGFAVGDPPVRVPVGARREIILAESVRLFRMHGYHDVNIELIGHASGINASSVYRYFPGKADILAAAFYRASERVTEATTIALTGARDDRQALRRMIESYVDLTFERSDLVTVYLAENNNLPEGDRHELRKVQRLHVEEWVRLLVAVRPGLVAGEARVLTHAALNLATDLSRWARFDRRTGMDRHLVRLMNVVLHA
ncbi:TetR/AcrR family transcriptional regulator [Actinoplanes sp. CA-142083]|uniref:TetR/AcrR family transcriptional regulator n=1 Tax=Actinoplanes sp. CA-142083 TaxID=3239903 RepID=UPI003D93288F